MKKIRTRYAPSPTGRMHVGNLRTALYAYLIAKHEGGDFLLRIEDTDQERFVEGALEIIENTLKYANLIPDEGPDKTEVTVPMCKVKDKSRVYTWSMPRSLLIKVKPIIAFAIRKDLTA